MGAFTAGADVACPRHAASQVLGDMEIYVDGVLDVEKELERLTGQKANLEGRIAGLEKKLGNENFVSKAPAEIVQKSRDQLDDLRSQLALLEENIARLA